MKRLNLYQLSHLLLPLGILALLLAACKAGGQDPVPEPEVTTLVYAKVSNDGVDWEAVKKFNRTHKDVQIEVRNYSLLSENGKHGIDLLMGRSLISLSWGVPKKRPRMLYHEYGQ